MKSCATRATDKRSRVPTVSARADVPSHDASARAVFLNFKDLKWEKTNPELGDRSPEISILHESLQETELLLRSPKNFHVDRHWHSANETITMIHGTFILKHDGSNERVALDQPGSFAWMPAKMIYEAWTTPDEEALYFITTDGKFDINWAEASPKPQ